ncbi:hypothetical protein O1611_g1010 [Lasiodiplodia mahajangana]|uniref:Uncharacterized protein n=1 Tax=Lasiodiplodia mahajangana TaxID=1108764 RepID=A0ACC2JZC2_9PEZI|nr:hypothetical protein O1611_g1010 [Lasiodiplodia mahajangana]
MPNSYFLSSWLEDSEYNQFYSAMLFHNPRSSHFPFRNITQEAPLTSWYTANQAKGTVAMISKAALEPGLIEWSIWSDQVVNGQLNPVLLDLANRGYYIQSEVLHIPERYAIFSPGPPRLQVYEGQASVVAYYLIIYIGAAFALASFLLGKLGQSNIKLNAIPLIIFIFILIELYIALLYPPQRAPGYVWDDWGV